MKLLRLLNSRGVRRTVLLRVTSGPTSPEKTSRVFSHIFQVSATEGCFLCPQHSIIRRSSKFTLLGGHIDLMFGYAMALPSILAPCPLSPRGKQKCSFSVLVRRRITVDPKLKAIFERKHEGIEGRVKLHLRKDKKHSHNALESCMTSEEVCANFPSHCVGVCAALTMLEPGRKLQLQRQKERLGKRGGLKLRRERRRRRRSTDCRPSPLFQHG